MKKRALPVILVIVILVTQLLSSTVFAQNMPEPEEQFVEGDAGTLLAPFSETETPQGKETQEREAVTGISLQNGAPEAADFAKAPENEPSPTPSIESEAPFTVTLNTAGGTAAVETVQTNAEGCLMEMPVAEKAQFSLLGWTLEEVLLPENYTIEDIEALSFVTTETLFTGDTTIHAVWLPAVEIQAQTLESSSDGINTSEPSNIDGVYQIGSAEELYWFRDTVNSGTNQISAVLTDNIDVSHTEWIPIGGGNGYATTCFKGIFDGAGHSVTGVSINAAYNFAGFFGYVNDGSALIKNLSVSGTVTSSSTNVGGIVGALANGTVQNCSFDGSVTNSKTSSGYAGGIVGYFNNTSTANSPTVRGCVNRGVITGPYAGGITGYGKNGAILECYNTGAVSGSSRAGGIAGQLQNNFTCSYCYSVGTLSGSATKGEITDFLYNSATLNNCGYMADLFGAGGGTKNECFVFTTPAELLVGLGSAFNADTGNINNGYPVLAWQGGSGSGEPTPKPAVSLQGATMIFVEQGVSPNATTITLSLQGIKEEDITNVEWKTNLIKGSPSLEEMVSITYPENNNRSLILSAIKGGGIVQVQVKVTVGETVYTDARDISVIPQITYASVVNADATHGVNPVLGEMATVQIYTLGGYLYDYENYPELNFKWKYNSSSAADIPGVTGKDYLIPDDGSFAAGNYIYVEILSGIKVLRNAMDTRGLIAAEPYDADTEYVEKASSIFDEDYGPLRPVYGTDENIIDMVEADLVNAGYDNIAVSIKSVEEIYGGGAVKQDGSIEFYYEDPNATPTLKMAQYKVTFTLTKDQASTDVEGIVVNIHWDRRKVETVMRSEILPGVTESTILDINDKDNITSDLVLPKIVDGKKWAQIEWSSSDETVVSISNEKQNTPNTLFEPYVGKVIRGETAKTVTLTAKFNFQFTSDFEQDIILYKTFTFKIPPLSSEEIDALRGELLKKIDAGVASAGFLDYVTKQQLVAADGVYTVNNDIQYPTTRDFGVDGKYFPVTISSTNNDVIETPDVANAARSFVYRPLPNNLAEEVNITITMTDSAKGISASRMYRFKVEPLTQAELDSAMALMNLVKNNYFEGLNNEVYTDYYSVTGKLNAFQEATWGWARSENTIRWIYTNSERTNDGIIADEIDGWVDQEAWRAFRSSDPTVLDHETLNFTQPEEDTFVRISSSLTHAIFGKYWEKFEGQAGYEMFEALYRQPVCEYIMVEGINHVERTPEELAKLRAQAIADISAPISATLILADFEAPQQPAALSEKAAISTMAGGQLLNTTISNLEAGTTVFGLFRQVMAKHNYTYSAVGSYIRSITDANGNTLAERDGGPNSGWIYTVNGTMPLVYMNGYTLKQGDVVAIKYTTDYTKETGGWTPGDPTTPSKPATPTTPDNPSNPEPPADSISSNPNSSSSGTSNAGVSHLENGSDGKPAIGSKNSSGLEGESGSSSNTSLEGGQPSAIAGGEKAELTNEENGVLGDGQTSFAEGFNDAYIKEIVEQEQDSPNPLMNIVLIVVITAFLAGSGIVYTKLIKKKSKN